MDAATQPNRPPLSAAAVEVQTLLTRMHQEEPYLPSTEAVLRCHAKRRLYKSFMQAGSAVIANWLFSNSQQPFHPNISATPSFAAALAVRAEWKCEPYETPMSFHYKDATPQSSGTTYQSPSQLQVPGRDILFVPVSLVAGSRLVGYTFGAGIAPDIANQPCPFGKPGSVFLPHAVGRFSYDYKTRDLLVVVHGLTDGVTGIMHIRHGGHDEVLDDHHRKPNGGGAYGQHTAGARQRTWYLVPGASYGHRRLPGKVLAMLHVPEAYVPSSPVYQFDAPLPLSEDNVSVMDCVASLERLVKGRYKSNSACLDQMDGHNGQVLNRMTFNSDTEFDIDSAIAVKVFKDLAVRNFYSFMSTASKSFQANWEQTRVQGQ